MKYFILSIGLLSILAGCTAEPMPGATPESEESPPSAGDVPEDVMENIRMDLWPSNEAPRQGQKPVLSISARRFMGSVGSGNEWSFEDAQAEAPAQDDEHTAIRFEAARGVFREDERAVLEGGVTAYLNDMIIHLEDIVWEINVANGATSSGGRAYSDHPVHIESPTQQLDASSLTIDPATATFELTDVSGEIHFGGIKQ